MDTRKHRDALRLMYRPSEVRLLFVGESPPANGTFFYSEDSNLWCYTRQAFASVYDDACLSNRGFCEFFKSLGCYLDDLCLDPVNDLPRVERRRACISAVESFAARLSTITPKAIVCVKRSIVPQIQAAVIAVGLEGASLHTLPFPSCGHQQEFVRLLAQTLREWQTDKHSGKNKHRDLECGKAEADMPFA